MNLREDKGWSYGYRSSIDAVADGDMIIAAAGRVQTDRTADSMIEIRREFVEYVGGRPATANEVDRIKLNQTRSLPGSFARNSNFLGSIVQSDGLGLPFDHDEGAAGRIAAVDLDGVRARARRLIDPDNLTWVVVGDLERIEAGVRALGYGEVEVWDAFGNDVR